MNKHNYLWWILQTSTKPGEVGMLYNTHAMKMLIALGASTEGLLDLAKQNTSSSIVRLMTPEYVTPSPTEVFREFDAIRQAPTDQERLEILRRSLTPSIARSKLSVTEPD